MSTLPQNSKHDALSNRRRCTLVQTDAKNQAPSQHRRPAVKRSQASDDAGPAISDDVAAQHSTVFVFIAERVFELVVAGVAGVATCHALAVRSLARAQT